MGWLFVGMVVVSTIYAVFCGNIADVSTEILNSAQSAVELCLSLMGIICLWCGVMKVAQRSGITDFLSRFLSPVLSRLFKGIDKSGRAMQAISMNVISNLLGLGNAATPLGIEAMKRIEEEESGNGIASRNMILFVVLNTASIQLVPTTVGALRALSASKSPFEIIPAVLISSIASVSVAILSVYIFDFVKRRKK